MSDESTHTDSTESKSQAHFSEKMHFHSMEEMSPDDFAILKHVHEQNLDQLPNLLIKLLKSLGGDEAYPVDRLTHCL